MTSPTWPENGYVMQVPVVSSSHLSPEAIEFLSDGRGSKLFGLVAGYRPKGFFVLIEDLEVDCTDAELAIVPDDFRKLLLWVNKVGFPWVRFDIDAGEIIEGFPIYPQGVQRI